MSSEGPLLRGPRWKPFGLSNDQMDGTDFVGAHLTLRMKSNVGSGADRYSEIPIADTI